VSPHRLTRAATGALAITALAAPSAHALPCEVACGSATPGPSAAPAQTVTRTIDEGFDWGAAGVGAGAAIVLLSLGGVRAGARRGELARSARNPATQEVTR
jgi:hypothetical protein